MTVGGGTGGVRVTVTSQGTFRLVGGKESRPWPRDPESRQGLSVPAARLLQYPTLRLSQWSFHQ